MTTLAPLVDEQLGQVLAVYELQSGGTLAVDLLAGATTLTVTDPADFHELGGQVYLASADDADNTSEVIAYLAADLTTGVVTLAAPWPADWPLYLAGDYVWVAPLATERRVDVALDGEADQLVTARLPYTLAAQVAVGVRPPDAGEWVKVGLTTLGYVVVDLEGEYPTTDPASVVITDPDTGEIIGGIGGDASFDTITADEIYSPTVPFRNADDLTLYVDAITGDDDNDGTAYPPLVDTFERTIANGAAGWGAADTGQVWSRDLNSGNLTDCDGHSGRLRTNGSGQNVFMRNLFGALDAEIYGVINFGSMVAAGTETAELTCRYKDSDNWYSFALNLTGATVVAIIYKRAGGSYTTLATSPTILVPTAGNLPTTDFAIRGQVQTNPDGGTDLRLKVWLVGSAEPEGYTITANDTQSALQSPGAVGANARSGGSQSGALITSFRDLTAAVIDAGGLVIDTTVGGVGPLQTVAEALVRVGDWNDGVVRVVLGGTVDEQINVLGIGGSGSLIIDGAGVATVYGTVNVVRCTSYVELRSFTLQDTGDIASPNKNAGSVEVGGCSFVYGFGLQIQSNASRASCIYGYNGSRGRFDQCQLSGPTANAANVIDACEVVFSACTGGGPTNAYRSSASIVFSIGSSQPTGGNLAANGGKIYTTANAEANPPPNGGGTPPPTSTKKTVTVNADSTCTYRPEWGWRTDNDEAYQGEYQGSGGLSRGVAFFGTKLTRSGKNADSGKVYIKRAGYGGASQGQDLFLCSFAQGSKPGGAPTIVDGPRAIGGLAWGAAKWFDLPASWVQHFLDGTAKSIGLYHGSASPYLICEGRKNNANRFQIKMTYH